MSEQLWDFYERVGDAIGDHLERFAIVMVAAFALLFSTGVIVG